MKMLLRPDEIEGGKTSDSFLRLRCLHTVKESSKNPWYVYAEAHQTFPTHSCGPLWPFRLPQDRKLRILYRLHRWKLAVATSSYCRSSVKLLALCIGLSEKTVFTVKGSGSSTQCGTQNRWGLRSSGQMDNPLADNQEPTGQDRESLQSMWLGIVDRDFPFPTFRRL